MPKITTFKSTVREVLEQIPETRDNDNMLYYYVVQKLDTHPVHSNLEMPLGEALQAMDAGDLPSMYSISRLRRVIQEEASKDPLLKYLCGDREGKKRLSEEVKTEIINNKKANK